MPRKLCAEKVTACCACTKNEYYCGRRLMDEFRWSYLGLEHRNHLYKCVDDVAADPVANCGWMSCHSGQCDCQVGQQYCGKDLISINWPNYTAAVIADA